METGPDELAEPVVEPVAEEAEEAAADEARSRRAGPAGRGDRLTRTQEAEGEDEEGAARAPRPRGAPRAGTGCLVPGCTYVQLKDYHRRNRCGCARRRRRAWADP